MGMRPSTMLFVSVACMSSLMAVSSSNWLCMWVFMELNLLSMTPLMVGEMYYYAESAVKYFLVQAVGGVLLLAFCMFSLGSGLLGVLLLKMGVAPFHFWVPQVYKSSSWGTVFMLSTVIKVPAFGLMMVVDSVSSFFYMFLISVNSFVGGFGGLLQNTVRGVVAYSSISHMSWVMASAMLGPGFVMYYGGIYFMMMAFILIPIVKSGVRSLSTVMGLLSLAGLPPLLGFVPKMYVLAELANSWLWVVLSISSLVSLGFYLLLSCYIMLGVKGPMKIDYLMSIFGLCFPFILLV